MDERGQVTPLVALLVIAVGGLLFGLARLGVAAADAARSTAAADAAALAGAAEGRPAAEAVAAANGGTLVGYEVEGREVEVRVRVGDAWAVARARAVPAPLPREQPGSGGPRGSPPRGAG